MTHYEPGLASRHLHAMSNSSQNTTDEDERVPPHSGYTSPSALDSRSASYQSSVGIEGEIDLVLEQISGTPQTFWGRDLPHTNGLVYGDLGTTSWTNGTSRTSERIPAAAAEDEQRSSHLVVLPPLASPRPLSVARRPPSTISDPSSTSDHSEHTSASSLGRRSAISKRPSGRVKVENPTHIPPTPEEQETQFNDDGWATDENADTTIPRVVINGLQPERTSNKSSPSATNVVLLPSSSRAPSAGTSLISFADKISVKSTRSGKSQRGACQAAQELSIPSHDALSASPPFLNRPATASVPAFREYVPLEVRLSQSPRHPRSTGVSEASHEDGTGLRPDSASRVGGYLNPSDPKLTTAGPTDRRDHADELASLRPMPSPRAPPQNKGQMKGWCCCTIM